jgi:hypothetical protein
MKAMRTLLSITLLCMLGCGYPGISGKVVDSVTGMPLEGAVVLAQWTKTHGFPGLTSHTVYKIEETETDKEGMFALSGVYSPTVNGPEMVIYKKGYVPWRNDMNFMDPTWEHYKENIWQDNITYKLELWKEEYSKMRLDDFIDIGIIGANYTDTPKFSELKKELGQEAQPERELKWKPKK